MFNEYKKFYNDFNNHNLTLPEKAILVEIYDHMEDSFKNKDFFDTERNDYFVKIPYQTLSNELEISVSTVKRTVGSLVQKGWLTTKRVHHRNNLIFINPDKQINR